MWLLFMLVQAGGVGLSDSKSLLMISFSNTLEFPVELAFCYLLIPLVSVNLLLS